MISISQLQVRGFRSLRDLTWSPGALNLVIGTNGSGKSNLLRALQLLGDGASRTLPETILRGGGFAPLLWDGRTDEIAWKIRTAGGDLTHDLTYELQLRRLGTTSAYRVEREILGYGADLVIDRRPGHALIVDEQGRAHSVTGGVRDDQPLVGTGPLLNPLLIGFTAALSSWSVYHDMRVDQDAAVRQAAVTRLDRRVAPDGQNLIPVLHTLYTTDREFRQQIDDAMRAAFGGDYEELLFPPAADQRVQLRLRWHSLTNSQSAADLSDGTIRFLLLLAILASPDPGGLIAIDEPETGLHPSMLPVVAEFARAASERTQVILTTHSSQLLDAFGDRAPTTTVATWADGQTRLSVIDGEELARWLKQYTLGALFRSGELEGLA